MGIQDFSQIFLACALFAKKTVSSFARSLVSRNRGEKSVDEDRFQSLLVRALWKLFYLGGDLG